MCYVTSVHLLLFPLSPPRAKKGEIVYFRSGSIGTSVASVFLGFELCIAYAELRHLFLSGDIRKGVKGGFGSMKE